MGPGSAAAFFCAVGTYAEALAVPEEHLARKPKNIKIAEAAGAPLVSLTAWQVGIPASSCRVCS